MQSFKQLFAVLFLVTLTQAAKLENVSRQSQQGNFFQGSGDTSDLFGSINGYLPPKVDKCEPEVITSTVYRTSPAVTVTQPAAGPRTVVTTDVSYVTVTARPVTQYETVFSTVFSTQYSTAYRTSTQVVPTTIVRSSIVTDYRTVTSTQIQTRTVTNTRTLPPQTQYITNTITLPASTVVQTDIRYSTRIDYRTITNTVTRTSSYTITSTSVAYSTQILPTTIYNTQSFTVTSTGYVTSTIPGRGFTTTVTETLPAQVRTVPCAQTTQTGYNYDAPARPFNFSNRKF